MAEGAIVDLFTSQNHPHRWVVLFIILLGNFVVMKMYIPLIFLFSISLVAQDADTTLVGLQKQVELASEDTTKAKALLQLGEYQLKRDFSQAESHFIKGLSLVNGKTQSELYHFRAAFYVQLGVVNRRKADYPTAIAYYVDALRYYEKMKDSSKSADVYHNMALVYRYQKEHRKAIENYKKAILLKEKVKDTFGMGAGYNMLGVSYRQNKQLDSALICYQKAKEYFTLINSKEDLHGVYGNLAVLYSMQKQYDRSIALKLANLNYYKRIGKQLSICVEYYNLASDYIKIKQWEKAIKYTDSSLQVGLDEGFTERVSVSFRRKSFVYAKMGNYKEAHENYRKYKKYNDTIFNIQNAKKMQALELNYQFEKEKQADSLQFLQEKREVELVAKSEASKKKLYLVLVFVTLIGGTIIGVLMRRNYVQRAKIAQATHDAEKKILDQEINIKEENIKRLIADNSMRLAFKEELLDKIKTEVIGAKPENIQKTLTSLTTQLKLQIDTENKLSGLQEKINYINKSFDEKLQKLYPELTSGEREVCALLRLNLSIKEIMTIRNVSSDSVKSMRRRIRKKMNISSDIEIEKFIQNLGE
ncbi:tetratricopeptide repeat protein [Aquimarina sp. D1M17]|uniref:tetratricopeptide repeat protein n=1 Tax=Aquimarina acroporae TaxID=2937283 RepID=UPI0020C0DD77|nr:tetratricopeptide repeat protein [Aquimarina acroporae]MCK8523801.1 tetratricopeptide repeat protein [Aquimarina acroporae]